MTFFKYLAITNLFATSYGKKVYARKPSRRFPDVEPAGFKDTLVVTSLQTWIGYKKRRRAWIARAAAVALRRCLRIFHLIVENPKHGLVTIQLE